MLAEREGPTSIQADHLEHAVAAVHPVVRQRDGRLGRGRDPSVDACQLRRCHGREAIRVHRQAASGFSTIVATPCPTPTQSAAIPYRPPRRRNSQTSVVMRRAPEQPAGGRWRSPRRSRSAAPPRSQLADAGEDLRGESLVDLDQVDLVERQAAGVQRPPDRRHRPHAHVGGSTPATPIETMRARVGAERLGRCSEARTRQAAPSLSVDALPAVTVPPSRNAAAGGKLLERGVGAGPLVDVDHDRARRRSVTEPRPARARRRTALRASLRRRGRGSGARTAPAPRARSRSARRRSRRLAHRLGRVALGHPRVDQPPAERCVVHRLRRRAAARPPASARPTGARLIDSAPPARYRSPSPRRSAREAWLTASRPEAQSRLTVTPGTVHRQPRQKRRHPSGVAVVLARLVGGPR